ncbi:MAG: GxxExxY protein [Planctomycetota bacterium]|nr:GxxExxY protein [Planctomycetota bacterium]
MEIHPLAHNYNRGDYGQRGGGNFSDRSRGGYGGGGHGEGGHGGRGRGRGSSRDRRGIPLSELDPALTAISHKVIGAATEVHVNLGPGFPEDVYFRALLAEMDAQSIPYKVDCAFDVVYKDKKLGEIVADLYIDDKFIVDVSATPGEIGSHERSVLRAQLKAADRVLGLIINFAGRRLKDGLVRVINVDKLRAERGDLFDDEGGDEGDDAEGGDYEYEDRG